MRVFAQPMRLQKMNDLSRQLVAAQVEMLRRLGHARDIELLFADGYARPDWGLADCLDEEAQRIVRETLGSPHSLYKTAR
jgi:hypothetical protein